MLTFKTLPSHAPPSPGLHTHKLNIDTDMQSPKPSSLYTPRSWQDGSVTRTDWLQDRMAARLDWVAPTPHLLQVLFFFYVGYVVTMCLCAEVFFFLFPHCAPHRGGLPFFPALFSGYAVFSQYRLQVLSTPPVSMYVLFVCVVYMYRLADG